MADFWDAPTEQKADFWDAPTEAPPKPTPAQTSKPTPSMLGDIANTAGSFIGELVGGAKDFLSFQPAEKGGILDWLTRGPQGGPLEIPRNPVSDILAATANKGAALGRMAFAPIEAVRKGLLQPGLERLGTTAGITPEYAGPLSESASHALSFLAPAELLNAPYALAGRTIAKPLERIRTAEKSNILNAARNDARAAEAEATYQKTLDEHLQKMASETAFQQAQSRPAQIVPELGGQMANELARQQYAKELAAFQQREGLAKRAEATMVRPGPGMTVETPITQRMAPFKKDEIYAPFEKVKDQVVDLQPVLDKAEEITARLGKESIAPSLQPKKAVSTAADITETGGEKAFAEIGDVLKRLEGSMSLQDVQTSMRGLFGLMRSTDSRVSRAGSELYKAFEETLKTSDAGKTLLKSNEQWRKASAAESLGAMIAESAPVKGGRMSFNPDAFATKLQKQTDAMQFIRDSFTPQEWKRLTDNMDLVFRTKAKVGEAPKAPTMLDEFFQTKGIEAKAVKNVPPRREIVKELPTEIQAEGLTPMSGWTRHAFAASATSLAHALGMPFWPGAIPAAYLASYVPQQYVKVIMKAASHPRGRAILEKLYAGAPPAMTDAAKAAALMRFLRANGEEPTQ